MLTLARSILNADVVLSFVWQETGTGLVRHIEAADSALADALNKETLILSPPRAELDAAGGVVFDTRRPAKWASNAIRSRLPGQVSAVLTASTHAEPGTLAVGGLMALWFAPEAATQAPEEAIRRGEELRRALSLVLVPDTQAPTTAARLDAATTTMAAADRIRAEHALREQSVNDELSGLLNRRGFKLLVEHELRVARRMQRHDALLLVDIDEFKTINDACGRAAGDQILRALSRILRDTARDSDVVGRIGGDDFVVYALDGIGSILGERIEAAVDAYNAKAHGAGTPAINVSIGVAEITTSEGFYAVLARADAALFKVKRSRGVVSSVA